jgi:hypothetical protein
MAELTQPEGGAEQVNQELPTPKFTDASAGSATSSVDTKALAQEVAKILRPDFEKVAQSTKDKRIAQLEKRLGVSDLAELEEQGVTIPENVKLEYRLRNLETQNQAPPSQTPTSQGSGASLTTQDVSEVVKQYQLDANAPEVLEALRGTYRNRDHFEATLAKVALARASRPQPSAAESAAISTESAATNKDTVSMIARLTELQKSPTRNKAEIAKLAADLDQRGWK